ncbi:MAG: hypothetical protein OET44_11985 [Gammaproteobacteria bacterium]|nr:hypothetical protein [Gammaproteobacteria bacterium]
MNQRAVGALQISRVMELTQPFTGHEFFPTPAGSEVLCRIQDFSSAPS